MFIIFQSFLHERISWGEIIMFSGDSMLRWDSGLGKKCQTVGRIQMFWESDSRKDIHKGQRVAPESPGKRTR